MRLHDQLSTRRPGIGLPGWFLSLTDRVLPRAWAAAVRERPAVLVAVGLVGIAVLMRLNNGVRYPSLHGYDGFGHATYIWYLLKNHYVPLAHEGWEHFHPPFYYALCAGIWSLLRSVQPKQVLKVISVTFSVLGLVSALVSYAIARRYFRDRPLAQFMAPAFILFLPVHIYTAPMLGNESLNTVLCSVALYLLLRTVQTERLLWAAALGLVLGLAMLTKATSLMYVATAGLVIALWGLHRGRWRAALTQLCVAGVLVLAVAGWFYVRNMQVYGTPLQMGREYFFNRHIEDSLATGHRGIGAYVTFDWQIFSNPTYVSGPVLDSVWTGAFATTWFDAHGNWFLPVGNFYPATRKVGRLLLALGTIPTVLVLIGLLAGVRRLWRDGWDDVLVVMFTAMAAIAAMFVAYTFGNRIFTAVKASYMMPAIVPFSFWFALGFDAVVRWGRAARLVVFADLTALVVVIVPVYTYQLLFEIPLGAHHWNALAVVDYFAGFEDLARTSFEGLANGYDFYLAHENLGSMALESGQVHQALFEFRDALRLVPSQVMGTPADREQLVTLTKADYYNSLAVIYDRLGWAADAFGAAQRSVSLDPSLPEAQYDLAVLMIKQGWPDAAAGALQRAIELDPGFRDARFLLGVAQQRAGDCRAALQTLEWAAAVKEWPRRTYSHVTGMGDQDDAAVVRRRHITHLPPSVNSDYALAVCLAKDNQADRAAHDLAQGLASGRLPAGALADDAWRQAAGGSLVPKVLPNIVVILIDTLRADHVGSYGYGRGTTPHLDELAAGGIRFSNAFSTSSWTRPAVASLFTGLMPSRHGVVNWQATLDVHVPTLAAQLAALGYETAAFSANFVAVGKVGGFDRGFEEFEALSQETTGGDYSFDYHGHHLRGYDARELTDAVGGWLAKTSRRPIFLYVHYLDPHPGYQPPEADRVLFETTSYTGNQGATAADITELERSGRHLQPSDLHHLIDLYDGEVHFADREVARLLERLAHDGIRDNCVIVVTADHGEEFQDHGHFWHSFTLYDEVVRIPMIFFARGTWELRPRIVPASVQLTDLLPTLIEMAGGVAPPEIDGHSLLPALRGNQGVLHESLVAELDPDPVVDKLVHPKRHRLAVWSDGWKVITSGDGAAELYKVDRDPGERHDVAAAHREEVDQLLALVDRRALTVRLAEQPPLTAAQREQMRALGYLP